MFIEDLKKLFLECIRQSIQIKYNENEKRYELYFTDNIEKPRLSSWYNEGQEFYNLEIDYKKLQVLGSTDLVSILNIDTKEKTEYKNQFSYFHLSTILNGSEYFNLNKNKFMQLKNNLDFAYLEGSDYISVRVIVNEKGGSRTLTITLKQFKSTMLKRINELEKMIDKLNNKKFKPLLKPKKPILIYDTYLKKICEKSFNSYQVDTIKNLIKKCNKIESIHNIIGIIGKYYGIPIIDCQNWTKDNGWGSYTYTFIRHSIDISDLSEDDKIVLKYLIDYLLINDKVSKIENNRYFEFSSRIMGMVQRSGGYTHISG